MLYCICTDATMKEWFLGRFKKKVSLDATTADGLPPVKNHLEFITCDTFKRQIHIMSTDTDKYTLGGSKTSTAHGNCCGLKVLAGEAAQIYGSIIFIPCAPIDNFVSIGAPDINVKYGKWYYEVKLRTTGIIQIGWADKEFRPNAINFGVGDCLHSWAFDGERVRIWHGPADEQHIATNYGRKWKVGDVVGCYLDVDARIMRFSLNGDDMGVAFSQFIYSDFLYPCISIQGKDNICELLLSEPEWKHKPSHTLGYQSLHGPRKEAPKTQSSAVVNPPAVPSAVQVTKPAVNNQILTQPVSPQSFTLCGPIRYDRPRGAGIGIHKIAQGGYELEIERTSEGVYRRPSLRIQNSECESHEEIFKRLFKEATKTNLLMCITALGAKSIAKSSTVGALTEHLITNFAAMSPTLTKQQIELVLTLIRTKVKKMSNPEPGWLIAQLKCNDIPYENEKVDHLKYKLEVACLAGESME